MSKLKMIEEWSEENLPDWSECRRVIDNHNYRLQNGYTLVIDEDPIPTTLHEFVYEYSDSDQYKDKYFRERLINVLNEVGNLGEWRGQMFKNPESI